MVVSHLELVVLADEVVFTSVLLVVMREEEHVLRHALHMRVVLDEFVVLKSRIECHSRGYSAKTHARSQPKHIPYEVGDLGSHTTLDVYLGHGKT